MDKTSFAAAALAALLTGAGAAEASTLLATNYSGPTPLYELDQATGAAVAIGGNASDIGDLTSDNLSTLWGVTLSANGNDLVTIDPTTGNVIGSVGITGTRAGQITSLAYDTVTGTLFGNTTPGFGDADGDDLYTIDPLSGAATLVGAINFDDVFALAFDLSGALFGIANSTSEFISINTASGAGALISQLSPAQRFDIAARPEDDTMFLLNSSDDSLYTIDTGNGVTSLVGPWNGPGNLAGLAFVGVPEATTLGLFGLGLVRLGLAGRRRVR